MTRDFAGGGNHLRRSQTTVERGSARRSNDGSVNDGSVICRNPGPLLN